jgi:hypothetical protein
MSAFPMSSFISWFFLILQIPFSSYSLHWKPLMCFGRHSSFNSNIKEV